MSGSIASFMPYWRLSKVLRNFRENHAEAVFMAGGNVVVDVTKDRIAENT